MASSEPVLENNKQIRIVLVGKTGSGKSSTGNTILGSKHFKTKFSPNSVTTKCMKMSGHVDGQEVAVIDTPGLYDTRFDAAETVRNISQCIFHAAPGPHVFLLVIRLGRHTEEEKQTVQYIQNMFGQDANRYSMVLFTGGDELEDDIQEFIHSNKDLQELVDKCDGWYHVFNNKTDDGSQVRELLKKVQNMTEQNGEKHYTNEMFQEAARATEEEKQRLLREKEEEIMKEQQELEEKLRAKHQQELKIMNEKLQAESERESKEVEDIIGKLKEKHEQELNQQKQKLMEKYKEQARDTAEKSNYLMNCLKEIGKEIVIQGIRWYLSDKGSSPANLFMLVVNERKRSNLYGDLRLGQVQPHNLNMDTIHKAMSLLSHQYPSHLLKQ